MRKIIALSQPFISHPSSSSSSSSYSSSSSSSHFLDWVALVSEDEEEPINELRDVFVHVNLRHRVKELNLKPQGKQQHSQHHSIRQPVNSRGLILLSRTSSFIQMGREELELTLRLFPANVYTLEA